MNICVVTMWALVSVIQPVGVEIIKEHNLINLVSLEISTICYSFMNML